MRGGPNTLQPRCKTGSPGIMYKVFCVLLSSVLVCTLGGITPAFVQSLRPAFAEEPPADVVIQYDENGNPIVLPEQATSPEGVDQATSQLPAQDPSTGGNSAAPNPSVTNPGESNSGGSFSGGASPSGGGNSGAANPEEADSTNPDNSSDDNGTGEPGASNPDGSQGSTDPQDPAGSQAPANPQDPTDPDNPQDPDNPLDPTNPINPESPDGSTGADSSDSNAADSDEHSESGVAPSPGGQQAPSSALCEDGASASNRPSYSYHGDTSYTPHHYSQDLTTEKFIAVIGEVARQIGQENDLYASVMIAQAILESASGNSALAQAPFNNLFGIKGTYNGEKVMMSTREDNGLGEFYTTTAAFRSYPSIKESMSDYSGLLKNQANDFYAPAWKNYAETYVEACNYLEGHYATDTAYSEKLQDLITTYDLTRFDEPLDYEIVDPTTVAVLDHNGKAVMDDDGNVVTRELTLADLVAQTTSYLGVPYVWGGTSPAGFDCSGLVQYSYHEALGIDIPRTSYYQCTIGQDVDFADLHMGDLLFFDFGSGTVSHVAMYLGDGYYIEAPHTGDVVKVTALEDKMPTFAKRVVVTRPVDNSANEPDVALTLSAAEKQDLALKDFYAGSDFSRVFHHTTGEMISIVPMNYYLAEVLAPDKV